MPKNTAGREDGRNYDESLKMLESEEGQLNAVFAVFGSAVQHSQHFEAAITKFLLTRSKLSNQASNLEELQALETRFQRKTLGALLKEFRRYVSIKSEAVSALLVAALERRNFLVHSFFLEREDKFGTESERLELLSELATIDHLLEQATVATNAMELALRETLEGKGDEIAEEQVVFSIEVHPPSSEDNPLHS